jgi:hypothetical protein
MLDINFFQMSVTNSTQLFFKQLLDKDPTKRLGVKGCLSGDISEQAFYRGVNFDQLERKQIIPPFRPQLVS